MLHACLAAYAMTMRLATCCTPQHIRHRYISACVHHRLVGYAHAMQALDKRSENDSEDQFRFLNIASHHCNGMRHVRPRHPATLQATSQLQLLCLDFAIMTEQPDLPEAFDPDPM